MAESKIYQAPSEPPPRPHLKPPKFAQVSDWECHSFANLGFAALDPPAQLQASLSRLFIASKEFFASSAEEKQPYVQRTDLADSSEEGYMSVPGEKEYITIRTTASAPPSIIEPAQETWKLAAELFHAMLQAVEQSLEMSPGSLTRSSAVLFWST